MVCKKIQKLTGASEVPPTQPLSSFGIDSMMGTELSVSNWVFIKDIKFRDGRMGAFPDVIFFIFTYF
jgi:hypothetical protein